LPATDLPSASEERDALIGAALEAGEAILPMFRDVTIASWSKDDASPVSEADLRANSVLREAVLSGKRADYGWLSEESADNLDRLERRRTLVVDPIDGTRAFLRGDDQFTVCLAVIEDGQALASVIFAPARDEMYAAAKGQGTQLNGANVKASAMDCVEGCTMIGAPRMFSHPGWPTPWPTMNIDYKNSTSYRMALVAAGTFDATLALAAKADWDSAPGTLIAEEAGAKVSDHRGRPFVFGKANPWQAGLVCAAAPLYPHIIDRLSHLPSDLSSLRA